MIIKGIKAERLYIHMVARGFKAVEDDDDDNTEEEICPHVKRAYIWTLDEKTERITIKAKK